MIRVGTRRSALAKAQTAWVVRELSKADPFARFETVEIVTSGDRVKGSLADAGGKGLFIKELEEALLERRIDLAVHSAKDLPGDLSPGLELACVPTREDPSDLLLTRESCAGLAALPPGCRVGTSSPRRKAQLLAARPDLSVMPLRGNIDTRLRKLAAGGLDAIMLAAAGLERLYGPRVSPESKVQSPADLGWGGMKSHVLSCAEMLPAAGQGALGIEARSGDAAVRDLARRIQDPAARLAVDAERAFLRLVGGDCYTPLAALAVPDLQAGTVSLEAGLWSADGSRGGKTGAQGPPAQAARDAHQALRDLYGLPA